MEFKQLFHSLQSKYHMETLNIQTAILSNNSVSLKHISFFLFLHCSTLYCNIISLTTSVLLISSSMDLAGSFPT